MKTSAKLVLAVMVMATTLMHSVYAQTKSEWAKAEVLQAESARVQLLLKNDAAALEGILADDLTFGHSNGVVDTKAQFLDRIKSGALKYEGLKHRDLKVQVYGETAVLTGATSVRLAPAAPGAAPLQFDLRFTAVYVRQGDRWQFVAWQSTLLPS